MSLWDEIKDVFTWSPLKEITEWLAPDIDQGGNRGIEIQREGSDNALPVVYGERIVGGVVVHKYVTGDDNEFLHFVVAFCHGPVNSIQQIYLNDLPIDDPEYQGAVTFQTRRGTASQTPITGAVNNIPNWSAEMEGKNVCYAWLRFVQFKSEQVWRGEPRVTALIRGKEVYDWRTDTTGYSKNPAVCSVDYLRDTIYGRGMEESRINYAEWTAAADFCDEATSSEVDRSTTTITYPPPGYNPTAVTTTGTVTVNNPRYELDAIIDTDSTVFDNFRELLRSFRGSPNRVNGLVGVSVETVGEPETTFTDDELIGDIEVSTAGTNNRYNRVIIKFPDKNSDNYGTNEAIYPPADSQQYQDWLDEDNGKELTGEFEFNTFSEQSDAEQMAEIIAKRSRADLTIKFSARGLARLVLPNDIIGLTTESYGWDNKPVRIVSRRERENGVFEFEALEHQNAIYPWSGSSWSEQIGGTALGTGVGIAPPANLTLTPDPALTSTGTLSWSLVDNAFVRFYEVELYQDVSGTDTLVYERTEYGREHTAPILDPGEYRFEVYSVSTINRRSDAAALTFTLSVPVAPPDLGLIVSNNAITSVPQLTGLNLGTQFEFDIVEGDGTGHTPESQARARTANFTGLIPSTQYTVFVRTINALGNSGWVSETRTTTANTAEIEAVLEESPAFNDLNDRANEALDRVGTAEREIDDLDVEVKFDRVDRQGSESSLLTAMADRVSYEWELSRRQKEDKRLISAVVDVDPDTGVITNKAFSYTDEAFNQAQVIIDGVEGSVTLQSERISLVEGEVQSLNAEFEVLPGVIDARATSIVTNAIEALEPAYAFNFFDSAQDWTAVNGTLTAGNSLVSMTWGDIKNTNVSYDAQENPSIRIVIERKAGTGWTGDLVVEFDDASTETFSGIIENPENIDARVVRIIDLQGEARYSGQVVAVRLVLGESVSDEFDIESITIGKPDATVQDIANLQAEINEAGLRIDANEAAIGLRVTQTAYDNNTVTFSNFTQTLDAEEGYIELRGQYDQIIDDDVIAKANNASIVIDGYEGTITQLAQTVSDNQDDNTQSFTDVQTELDSVNGTIRNQAFSIQRNTHGVDTALSDSLVGEADYVLFKWGQLDRNRDFAFAVQELQAKTGPDGSLAQSILQLDANFNGLDNTFSSFVDETRLAFADADSALSSAVLDLEAQIDGAESSAVATATDVLNARIGYCVDSEGNPTGAEDEATCLLTTGNEWITGAPLAESIRATRITTADGGEASFSQIGQTYETKDGELVARGAVLTDVNGYASGFVNTNDGETSDFDIIASRFRVGDNVGGSFVPKLGLEDVEGVPTLTLRGRLVLEDGFQVNEQADIQGLDGQDGANGAGQYAGEYTNVTTNPSGINNRFFAVTGRNPVFGDIFTQVPTSSGGVYTRYYDGTQWIAPPLLFVDGNLVATGTIAGDRLISNTVIQGPIFRTSNYSAGSSGIEINGQTDSIEINASDSGATSTFTGSSWVINDGTVNRLEIGLNI